MIEIAVGRNPAETLVLELLKSMEDGNLHVRIPELCTPDFCLGKQWVAHDQRSERTL